MNASKCRLSSVVERLPEEQSVSGSIPLDGTKTFSLKLKIFEVNKYMNYEKIYNSLIEKRQQEVLHYNKDYKNEQHHIVPRSCGGSNNKENLVYLTCREHFIAHLLLVKIAL